jgi:hypothetical protein
MKKIIACMMMPVLIVSSVGLTACKDKSTGNQLKIEGRTQVQRIEKEVEEIVSPLISSALVIKMIADLEVEYTTGITNPYQNNKKYFSGFQKATNLGVFGADLSYVTLYKKQQDIINYLEAMRYLANGLNTSRTYNEEMYDDIVDNLDERDKLVEKLTDSFNNTYSDMIHNEQQNQALLVIGGAWVEGMYLTTHLEYAAHQFEGFSEIILEQKKSFLRYLEIIQPYINDPGFSDFVILLEPVNMVFEGLGTSLTEQNIKDITKAITEVREQIVK